MRKPISLHIYPPVGQPPGSKEINNSHKNASATTTKKTTTKNKHDSNKCYLTISCLKYLRHCSFKVIYYTSCIKEGARIYDVCLVFSHEKNVMRKRTATLSARKPRCKASISLNIIFPYFLPVCCLKQYFLNSQFNELFAWRH